ncbi:hypothetical protein PAMA_016241 [Pampus argenteus]
MANGSVSEPPVCREVSCPIPTGISNGVITFAVMRQHSYKDKVKYACNEHYILDGEAEIQCKNTGAWSPKPVCRAPCTVGIKRGRIFYNAKKLWIGDLKPNRVLHGEHVAFYCLNRDDRCGYPVASTCNDGTLPIPECFVVCFRPELGANIKVDGLQRYFRAGAEVTLSCKQGYTPVLGPRKIVCAASGEWTKTKLKCIPKRCPYPDLLPNGELYYEDTVYQSMINYTCHSGYTLTGGSTAVCLANGTWSIPVPDCKPVSCDLAPIPKFGMIIYDKSIRGNTTDYGVGGTYKCLPPYVLIGNARAECTASGSWTKTPECKVVTCPTPENIDKGYMSISLRRHYNFMETVKYGCIGDYVVEGSIQIVCQDNGQWSELPSCKAPCHVSIEKGRILYNGRKLWIKDLKPNRVLHKEIVSVYCMNKARKCGYAVPTQCIDGRLQIPECFEEPSFLNYNLHSNSLPSEITQC